MATEKEIYDAWTLHYGNLTVMNNIGDCFSQLVVCYIVHVTASLMIVVSEERCGLQRCQEEGNTNEEQSAMRKGENVFF